MAAVPLAALTTVAVPAKATLAFSFGSPTCGAPSTSNAYASGSCTGSLGSVNPSNGLNGVTANGDITAYQQSSGSGFGLTIIWSGGVTGLLSAPTQIPVAWDFTVTPTDTSHTYNVTLDFNFSGGGTGSTEEISGGFTGPQTFTGMDLVTLSNTIASYSISLSVDQPLTGNNTYLLNVSVPAITSLDVNYVPEPATFVLVAPMLGYLALRRRRKRV